jgi:hypothetical protein
VDGDSVYFVSEPIAAEPDGSNVRLIIRSGHHEWLFETPRGNFVESWAGFTTVVRTISTRHCEVIEMDSARA